MRYVLALALLSVPALAGAPKVHFDIGGGVPVDNDTDDEVVIGVQANGQNQPTSETAAGWAKYPGNPVLGGNLGTCFDISVLKEEETYRMWFSWRPKKSIALVESKNGTEWSDPLNRHWA